MSFCAEGGGRVWGEESPGILRRKAERTDTFVVGGSGAFFCYLTRVCALFVEGYMRRELATLCSD
jgi:hypothetical protein